MNECIIIFTHIYMFYEMVSLMYPTIIFTDIYVFCEMVLLINMHPTLGTKIIECVLN